MSGRYGFVIDKQEKNSGTVRMDENFKRKKRGLFPFAKVVVKAEEMTDDITDNFYLIKDF